MTGEASPGPDFLPLSVDELRSQYSAYRRRQARGLVRLLPREAVRPLYRGALRLGFGLGAEADPLDALLRYCETLLPLPPFEAWREDVLRHPSAHLQDLDDSAYAPTSEAPTTVEARTFTFGGNPWIARLRSFREGQTWSGYIHFEAAGSPHAHRTAVIFREPDPVNVRERFLSFDGRALEAFLRSALP